MGSIAQRRGAALFALILAGLVLAAPARANLVQWTTGTGATGHWYELILDDTVGWTAAHTAATAKGGYLATILSAEEQAFILSTFFKVGSGYGSYWIGLTDAETEGVFKWVTGEPFSYANWGIGQPDNNEAFAGGPEDWVQLVWRSDGATPHEGRWNDAPEQGFFGRTDFPHLNRKGYLVEYTVIPVPAALPIMAAALAGFGFAGYRRFRRGAPAS